MLDKFHVIDGTPMESLGTKVGPDQHVVGYGSLWTDRLNGGLALTLFDPKRQLGAISHLGIRKNPIRMVYNLLEGLHLAGLDPNNKGYQPPGLEAAIAGGSGKMSEAAVSVRDLLSDLMIPIIGQDLGGESTWRAVYLHCNKRRDSAPGKVEVYRYVADQ